MSFNHDPHKVHLTLCGGAAIALYSTGLKKLVEEYSAAVEKDPSCGYPKITVNFIDTSVNNIKVVEHKPEQFWQVTSDALSGPEVAGSGGMRATNAEITVKNIRQFCDKKGYVQKVSKETHIVVFSGSGGKCS